jgi:septal ring factor EnvC (AmiA/AmiB activator)
VTDATPSQTPVEDSLIPTAVIIAFPARVRPPSPQPAAPQAAGLQAAEPQPEDRLARALASLNAAVMEQRTAISSWRAALGELKTSTSGLDESLQRYRTNLQSLGTSVSELQAKSWTLEAWADGVAAD